MRLRSEEDPAPRFEASPLPGHRRVWRFALDPRATAGFVEAARHVPARRLDYFPYERFLLAREAESAFGPGFGAALREALLNRELGALVVDFGKALGRDDDGLRALTAVAHLVGNPTPDVLSGTYYASVRVSPGPQSSPVFDPGAFWLHNDATIEDTAAEWVLVLREGQNESSGGDTLLLHLDEWEELEAFSRHPLATVPMLRLGPQPNDPRQRSWGHHLRMNPLLRPVFGGNVESGRPTVAFNQQFIHVRSHEEADYVHQMTDSLARSRHVQTLSLGDGTLYLVNNTFWLHGRSGVRFSSECGYRSVLRSRGVFFEEHQLAHAARRG